MRELKDALIIYGKEIKNILKDKRTLVMTAFLPLFLMPAIFGVLGGMSERETKQLEENRYFVDVQGIDDERFFTALHNTLPLTDSTEEADAAISVIFPAGYSPGEQGTVTLIYDSTSKSESYGVRRVEEAIEQYQEQLAEEKLREKGLSLSSLRGLSLERVDTAGETSGGTAFLAILLPYMVLIYIFSSSMGVGLDTTAGEKERGSLASLLVNQVSRSSIAVGKILYVVTISLVNSFSTFLGLLIAFSIGKGFFSGAGDSGTASGIGQLGSPGVIGLFLTLVSISGIIAAVVILVGSLARSTKEGASYIMPIYILVIILGVMTMEMEVSRSYIIFLVPLLNAILTMKGIILGNFAIAQLLITLGVNLALVAVLVLGITRLFNSEKILTESAG